MSNVWVYKLNGQSQCSSDPATPETEIRSQLSLLIGESNILRRGDDGSRIMPQLCGLPTGEYYTYEITAAGFDILQTGISGPCGFHPLDDILSIKSAKDINFSELVGSLVTQQPIYISQLTGRSLRVIPPNSVITKDWRPDRCNIDVNEHGIIARIWFG